jgi:hypothetical protein
MRFALILNAMSFPLVLAAVAGGAHTPTNLTYLEEKSMKKVCRVTYFCRPLRRCVPFVANGE